MNAPAPVLLALCAEMLSRGVSVEMDGPWLCHEGACVALVTKRGKLSLASVRDGLTALYLDGYRPSVVDVARVNVAVTATEIVRRCEERARQDVRAACHREGHACENSGLCHRCGEVVNADWWALAQEAAGAACEEIVHV